MPESCSIPGCTSRRSKDKASRISFYHLPIDSSIRYQWLVSIKKVSEHTRICSLHFVGGKKTVENPLPTLFPWSKQTLQNKRKPPCNRPSPEIPVKKVKQDIIESACVPSDNNCEKQKEIDAERDC